MYIGSFDPLTVVVMLEVMKSSYCEEPAPSRPRSRPPRAVASVWKRLAKLVRRATPRAVTVRPGASVS
ncbi:MAG TPA: hypothetical protein PKL84_10580 [Candidatus Hydrogenedentes bacterium]|nr:hypothetical protein [Candidatus Hydrogenedentota bacterium]